MKDVRGEEHHKRSKNTSESKSALKPLDPKDHHKLFGAVRLVT